MKCDCGNEATIQHDMDLPAICEVCNHMVFIRMSMPDLKMSDKGVRKLAETLTEIANEETND